MPGNVPAPKVWTLPDRKHGSGPTSLPAKVNGHDRVRQGGEVERGPAQQTDKPVTGQPVECAVHQRDQPARFDIVLLEPAGARRRRSPNTGGACPARRPDVRAPRAALMPLSGAVVATRSAKIFIEPALETVSFC